MNNYKKAIQVNDELYRIEHSRYGLQLWSKIKTRQAHRSYGRSKICAVTGKIISKGAFAYRPLANGYNRMDRISEEGVKILEANR